MNKSPIHLAAATAMYDIFKNDWITELCKDNHQHYPSMKDFSEPLGYFSQIHVRRFQSLEAWVIYKHQFFL